MSLRPEKGPIDALTDMNIVLFAMWFWAMPMVAAIEEGVPMMGVAICTFFSLFFIVLQMWMPI